MGRGKYLIFGLKLWGRKPFSPRLVTAERVSRVNRTDEKAEDQVPGGCEPTASGFAGNARKQVGTEAPGCQGSHAGSAQTSRSVFL